MKKVVIVVAVTLIGLFALVLNDYQLKKRDFEVNRGEFSKRLEWIDLLTGKINQYFFDHGWFPDSLQQIDSIFYQRANERSRAETKYRFFIDPFSGEFFYYLPERTKYGKPDAFYILSTGIDSKIDNRKSEEPLRLYDTATFSYFNFYFGRKDLLIGKGSIEDWISKASGMKVSMQWLAKRYDPSGKIKLPACVIFNGTVDKVNDKYFSIVDDQSTIKGVCYLAPSEGKVAITAGNKIQVKGIFYRIDFEPDTAITFLNCRILERGN